MRKSSAVLLLLAAVHVSGAARNADVLRSGMTQERMVRSMYAKVALYSHAARVDELQGAEDPLGDRGGLRFELRNFRSGRVEEILETRARDLVSLPEAEILDGMISGGAGEDGREEAALLVEWQKAEDGSTALGRDFTVADLFALEPERYFDAGDYVTYDVTVSMDGQTHTSRALALFHNRYDDDPGAVPEIWDNVSGMHGMMGAVWQERRAPMSASRHRAGAAAPFRPAKLVGGHGKDRGFQSEDALIMATGGGYYEKTFKTNIDLVGHLSGYHSGQATYAAQCYAVSATHQRCDSRSPTVLMTEFGEVAGLYTHARGKSTSSTSSTGPLSQEVSCGGGAVFSVKKCLALTNCNFTPSISVGVSGQGASASVSVSFTNGGDVWNESHGEAFACEKDPEIDNPPPVIPPSVEDQPCPSANVWVMVVDGVPSTICSSPVILDVDGNGIALTDAKGGVAFDLDSDAAKETISWIAAGSDDAFLALDRNGNGAIDNGRELFGNFTPQRSSSTPNGFVALADLDTNVDGVVDARDPDFPSLLLWQDGNHDGVSQHSELHGLTEMGVLQLHLDYKTSKKVDQYGNAFRYRAKVDSSRGSSTEHWAWDVFFVRLN
jgi:hypothetical protein